MFENFPYRCDSQESYIIMVKSTYKPFQTKFRFYITDESGHWQVVDDKDGTCFDCENKTEAKESAAFFRAYVKRHGDIDLNAVPCDLSSELHYDKWTEARLMANQKEL